MKTRTLCVLPPELCRAFLAAGPLTQILQHHADNDIGVAVTDRYTHHILTFLEGINKTSKVTLQDLVRRPPCAPPPLPSPPPRTRD